MKQLVVLTIYFCSLIQVIYNKTCTINRYVMDCTNLNLTDCPLTNESVKTLILDGNSLKNFTSPNCLKWVQLENLYIRKNRLINISNFENFKELKLLDLSENELKNVSISVNKLKIINFSSNLIECVNLKFGSWKQLSHLYLRNNLINKTNLNVLIKSLHYGNVKLLDLSYNKIDKIPSEFMTLDCQYELLINFTGNQLSTIAFSNFIQKSPKIFYYDFSFNNMTSFSINNFMNIRKLNFSNNDLSIIDGNSLNYFNNIEYLDVSRNPLNCFCNESDKFIEWMKEHKSIVQNQDETRCKYENVPIFDIKCPDITSTIKPISSTTSSTSTTTSTSATITSSTNPSQTTTFNHTTSKPAFNKSLKIALAILIIPIAFIILIISTLFWIFHKKPGYSGLVKSKCLSCFSNCCPRNSFKYRNLSTCNQPPNLFDSDENIDTAGSLLVICSSKDSKWIREDIVKDISFAHNIIDSKVRGLPSSDFVLIVVNGDKSLKDYVFINNVEKALQMKEDSEIRLLIHKMPNFTKLLVDNPLTNYIKDMMHEKIYFKYDENCPSSCIDSLKLWLNFNV